MAITTRTSEELLTCLDSLSALNAFVIGDLVLDRYIWGKVDRISPEAPVPVVKVNRTEDRLGCAGNAARNLRAIEVKTSMCGVVGEDDEGRIIERLLGSIGIKSDHIFIDQSLSTIVKTRVIAHSQQVVRIDREEDVDVTPLRQQNFLKSIQKSLDSPDFIIVSDYGKGAVTKELFDMLSAEKESGRINCPIIVDPHPTNFDCYHGITIAKPNRAEAEKAAGITICDHSSAIKAARILREAWQSEMMMITLGEGGLVIASDSDPDGIFLETAAQEVYDVSGAGDAVTAVFSAALVQSGDVRLAGELANLAAGLVVSEVGTAPVNTEKLRALLRGRG
jgi:rfaE bifunctional protein kinase chain/domain